MRWCGEEDQPYQIEVVCYGTEPPVSAVGLVHRVGGTIVREDKTPAEGHAGTYGSTRNGDLDWPAIHAANAALFAERHGCGVPPLGSALDVGIVRGLPGGG